MLSALLKMMSIGKGENKSSASLRYLIKSLFAKFLAMMVMNKKNCMCVLLVLEFLVILFSIVKVRRLTGRCFLIDSHFCSVDESASSLTVGKKSGGSLTAVDNKKKEKCSNLVEVCEVEPPAYGM